MWKYPSSLSFTSAARCTERLIRDAGIRSNETRSLTLNSGFSLRQYEGFRALLRYSRTSDRDRRVLTTAPSKALRIFLKSTDDIIPRRFRDGGTSMVRI